MPDLIKSLQGRDLGHLRIVAELWGIEFDVPDLRSGLQRLILVMLNHERAEELIADLPAEAHNALYELLQSPEGRLSWAQFARRFGIVREMGPGRRDRDQPYLNPVSPAEMLWYRGLVARAFFDTPSGPEEFAYIPDDLVMVLPPPQSTVGTVQPPLGRAATPLERAHIQPATDRLLDHACTLLAALRMGFSLEKLQALEQDWNQESGVARFPAGSPPLTAKALKTLLAAAGLLDPNDIPLPEPTRLFLESSREQALAQLARTWLHTSLFNDLHLVPGLVIEGEWRNDPVRARQSVLDFLATVPGIDAEPSREAHALIFWSLDSFIAGVRQAYPDFQRQAGDYDSWYLRDEETGEYLRGFEHWDRVDGGLVRYLLTGPLHWLGILDLGWTAAPVESGARLASFRYSKWAAALLHAQPPAGLPEENASLQVRSDARLVAPRLAPRAVRYLMARFSEWEGEKGEGYHYRITPRSLQQARKQGLKPNHLLALLQRYANTVAPSLVKAIERWERLGVEARFENVLVLRLSSPELLQTVRGSKAGRFLGDPLGPTTVIVKTGALDKVLAILAELGYLGEVE